MQNYKGYYVGQIVTTKVNYNALPSGTNFFIKEFQPFQIKKGFFICGLTVYGKIVKLRANEIQTKKAKNNNKKLLKLIK